MKGKHDYIDSLIEDFVKVVKSSKSKVPIESKWKSIKSELQLQGYEGRTIKKVVSRIRTEVKTLDKTKAINQNRIKWVCGFTKANGDKIKGIVVSGEEIWKPIDEESGERLQIRLDNAGNNIITNIDEFIRIATSLLTSWSYVDVAVGLAFLTGRRSIEILALGSFEVKDKSHVLFKGQAKKRDKDIKGYTIPVLCDSQLVVNGLKRLNGLKNFDNLTNEQIHNSTSASLNKAVKKYFNRFAVKELTMHDLRRIYAKYCLDKFLGKDKFIKVKNDRFFLSKLLGHEHDKKGTGTETGLSYLDFTIQYNT